MIPKQFPMDIPYTFWAHFIVPFNDMIQMVQNARFYKHKTEMDEVMRRDSEKCPKWPSVITLWQISMSEKENNVCKILHLFTSVYKRLTAPFCTYLNVARRYVNCVFLLTYYNVTGFFSLPIRILLFMNKVFFGRRQDTLW